MKDNWIDILKNRMTETSVAPPDGMWERISSDLDGCNHRKRRAIVPAWLWSGVAACVALAVTYVSFFTGSDKIGLDVNTIQYNAIQTEPPAKDNTPAPEIQPVDNQNTALNLFNIYHTPKANAVIPNDTTAISEPAPVITDVELHPTCPAEDTLKTIIHGNQPLADSESKYLCFAKSHRGISVDLYACNPYESVKSSTGHYDTLDMTADPGTLNGNRPDPGDDRPKSRLTGDNGNTLVEARHRQPIRFGLSVKYHISDRFSLGAGLTYSRLSSTITRQSLSNATFEEDQTLHYLGVPVSIDFNLASYKQTLSVYLTSGLMGEKCISGHATSYIGQSRDISERQWQFSVFAGAGIQFNLSRHLALYAEPLATYYFDNHSDIVNIYHDRPLNIDLRLGLRLTLK